MFSLVKPAHQLLRPAVFILPHQVKNMDNPIRLHAVMQLFKQTQQSLVNQVVNGAGKQNLVKLVRGKGTSAQVCRHEMHVRSIMKAPSCRFDRNGVDIHSMVVELAKSIGDMPVGTTEIEQFARWMKFREVKLSFEFHRTKHRLNRIPDNRN